ncbi:MAG: ribosomal protein S18-alanine N-acetyltransferase [Ruminococcus sp.]|nr:ribosomal protein S18-alanine N-acetyltransferase [Ruminococcus sp.]
MEIIRADKNTQKQIFESLSAIDKLCVGAEGWSAESFESEAAKDNGIVLYTVENGNITGLICGFFAADEAEITSVAVSPEHRRKGIAAALMEEYFRTLPDVVESIFLEVRESNSAAIGLYQKFGFQKISLRKNFYSFPDENAVVMQKLLNKEG